MTAIRPLTSTAVPIAVVEERPHVQAPDRLQPLPSTGRQRNRWSESHVRDLFGERPPKPWARFSVPPDLTQVTRLRGVRGQPAEARVRLLKAELRRLGAEDHFVRTTMASMMGDRG